MNESASSLTRWTQVLNELEFIKQDAELFCRPYIIRLEDNITTLQQMYRDEPDPVEKMKMLHDIHSIREELKDIKNAFKVFNKIV